MDLIFTKTVDDLKLPGIYYLIKSCIMVNKFIS